MLALPNLDRVLPQVRPAGVQSAIVRSWLMMGSAHYCSSMSTGHCCPSVGARPQDRGQKPMPRTWHGSMQMQGPALAALPCTLVWATTWQQDANTEIAPRIGLPHLPVSWPEPTKADEREDRWLGLCWIGAGFQAGGPG